MKTATISICSIKLRTGRFSKQLNIRPTTSYVTHSGEGEVIILRKHDSPFVDRFPKDTELYRAMTTKSQRVEADGYHHQPRLS